MPSNAETPNAGGSLVTVVGSTVVALGADSSPPESVKALVTTFAASLATLTSSVSVAKPAGLSASLWFSHVSDCAPTTRLEQSQPAFGGINGFGGPISPPSAVTPLGSVTVNVSG